MKWNESGDGSLNICDDDCKVVTRLTPSDVEDGLFILTYTYEVGSCWETREIRAETREEARAQAEFTLHELWLELADYHEWHANYYRGLL